MSSTAFPLGTYVGNPNNSSASDEAAFEKQFNSFVSAMGGAKPKFMNAFVDYGSAPSTWAANQNWWAASWAQSPVVGTSMTPVIGIPMATNSYFGNQDAFFKGIIAGKYDSAYKSIVDAWANNGYKTMYLRLGYEMNGSWFPWSVTSNPQTQSDWIKAFQHLSTLMKSEATKDGATAKIVWNPTDMNWCDSKVASLYPGDKYVDVVADDDYSPVYPLDLTDWATGGKTQDSSFAQWDAKAANREHFWTYPDATQSDPTGKSGHGWTLQQSMDFAKAHGKSFAMAETGAGGDGVTNGPSDDPAFAQWLHDTLSQPGGPNIAFVNVWDYNTYNGGDASGNWDFSSAGAGKPLEKAAWGKYFGSGSGSGTQGGTGAPDPIHATIGHQTIHGTSARDIVFVSSGANTVRTAAGNDSVVITRGSANRINAGTGNNAISEQSAGGNTIVLPTVAGGGKDVIYGNVLHDGDKFSVTAALAGTNWNHDLSQAGQFLRITYNPNSGNSYVDVMQNGTPHAVAILAGQGHITTADFLAHITA